MRPVLLFPESPTQQQPGTQQPGTQPDLSRFSVMKYVALSCKGPDHPGSDRCRLSFRTCGRGETQRKRVRQCAAGCPTPGNSASAGTFSSKAAVRHHVPGIVPSALSCMRAPLEEGRRSTRQLARGATRGSAGRRDRPAGAKAVVSCSAPTKAIPAANERVCFLLRMFRERSLTN